MRSSTSPPPALQRAPGSDHTCAILRSRTAFATVRYRLAILMTGVSVEKSFKCPATIFHQLASDATPWFLGVVRSAIACSQQIPTSYIQWCCRIHLGIIQWVTSVKIIKNEVGCRDDTRAKNCWNKKALRGGLRACNNLPQPPPYIFGFWGLRKIVACSQSSSQCLLVSTVFGTVSSLHQGLHF